MKRLVFLLVFLVAGTALAQKPPAELKKLDPFVGKWSCKGTVFAGEWGPEHPIIFKIDSHWSLGGMWLYFGYDETKTAKSPQPLKGIGLMSYDPEIKKFVDGWVDNSGMYQTSQSDGWNGDTMVFEGPAHGGGMSGTARDTFTRKGTKQLDHVFDLQMGGTWKKVESDTCKKQ